MKEEDRIIGYIENGIVIDHIPIGKVWKIAEILGVTRERKGRVSLGDGYESKKIGKKGVIKIEDVNLDDYQLNLIALIAKDASVSIIKNGSVVEKIKAVIPDILKGIILCPNLNCITNDSHEKIVPVIYYNTQKGFKCYFCSREFKDNEINFL
ncbi:MAG: aspartate carbamoyltransferase regulatory subunit [Candidatus Pacearchaeota archaeon]